MTRLVPITCLLITIFIQNSHAALEQALREDIRDQRLDEFTAVEAAFILSGIDSKTTLRFYTDWYKKLLDRLGSFNLDHFDHRGSTSKVFAYLHSHHLLNYREKATTLVDVVHYQQYNCVAGTILYNLVCDNLGWPTEAFETPTHTYTRFPNADRNLIVENTTGMGYDILQNLHNYSRYLAQFYPDKQIHRIGLDQLYYHEHSNGRVITNTELLGLLAYNQAYLSREEDDYARAYDYVLLAQDFNHDSRSNIDFEISLYDRWGKTLFDQSKFLEAYEVFADGVYRYPDIDEFRHNCKAAFFNAQHQLWQDKNWRKAHRLIRDILSLEVVDDDDVERLGELLAAWSSYGRSIAAPALKRQIRELGRDLRAYP